MSPHRRRTKVLGLLAIALAMPAMALLVEANANRMDPVRVHNSAILIDGHNDIPQALLDDGFDLAEDGRGRYDTDLDRLRQGGVTAAFLSIYVDTALADRGEPYAPRARALVGAVARQAERHADRMFIATTAADVERAKKEGRFAALLGLEGAHALEGSLEVLRELHAAGVRYVTLTHTRSNEFADSAGSWRESDPAKLAALRVHGGLSDRGRELVAEMNRLGVLVDVSHVSDETVADVLEVARAPVIASHSGARALADVRRNIPDDLLKAIGAKGGVVMVNFHSAFLDPAVGPGVDGWATLQGKEQEALAARYGRGEQYARALYQVMRFGQQPSTTLDRVADHIEHIARVAGVDAVGLGSDFDGDILPPWELGDVSRFPNLTADLRYHGWDRDAIHKALGGNTLRVMRAAERVAAEGTTDGQPR